MKYFWVSIFKMCRGLILPAAVGVLVMRFINTNGILRFAVWVCLYTAVYGASMWMLGMNEDEKQQIGSILYRFIRKRK